MASSIDDAGEQIKVKMQELLDRSKEGEGVMAILRSMGINEFDGTEWLRKNKQGEIKEAKKEQIKRRKEKDANKRPN